MATEFPYCAKSIYLFQKLDGLDVCLFAMHVQEYGMDCPAPNRGKVYISMIDSVKLFQPEGPLRGKVYQEVIIGYLQYAKEIG